MTRTPPSTSAPPVDRSSTPAPCRPGSSPTSRPATSSSSPPAAAASRPDGRRDRSLPRGHDRQQRGHLGIAPGRERRGDEQADALLAYRAAGPRAGVAPRPPDEIEPARPDRAADLLRAHPEGGLLAAHEALRPELLAIWHH